MKHLDEILKPKYKVLLRKDDWVFIFNEDGEVIWQCHKEKAFLEELLTLLGADWERA